MDLLLAGKGTCCQPFATACVEFAKRFRVRKRDSLPLLPCKPKLAILS